VRSGLLRVVRLLVVWAHRAHRAGVVVLAGVAVRRDAVRANAGIVATLANASWRRRSRSGSEIEGFHVLAGLPQGPQRRQVDRLLASGLRLLVVVLGSAAGA
ncbi:hypothetical protein QBA74_41815, partial [Streptomyces scabiei]|uniref:hypothetical protein n=1 Tax=Streptomyces scabiei TaxID=1930 RepID=UPI002FEFC20D